MELRDVMFALLGLVFFCLIFLVCFCLIWYNSSHFPVPFIWDENACVKDSSALSEEVFTQAFEPYRNCETLKTESVCSRCVR